LGFSDKIPTKRRAQLEAYGVTPGAHVRVLQHSPVTIILIDQLELALEGELAKQVHIKA
jgi:Fe2+ transport system protein FeoA